MRDPDMDRFHRAIAAANADTFAQMRADRNAAGGIEPVTQRPAPRTVISMVVSGGHPNPDSSSNLVATTNPFFEKWTQPLDPRRMSGFLTSGR